ncbi:alkaline phosphatase family protein [Flaviaesturariibacter amylovorans]|uniref:Phosphoglyceromutase n=1 Tax=Flaviaesturariibacter amylovorans TaxID=1084520 RepID=A0ABP8H0Q9_9BACT
MKLGMVLGLLVLWGTSLGSADSRIKDEPNGQNLVIITLDGFRWQELFEGADADLISDPAWTQDTAYTKALYWHADPAVRRERLMPFFWNVIAKRGQLHGNRKVGSHVNTKNFYQISYPGYNEIFTGIADPFISTNKKVRNKNRNFLEHLNAMPAYAGKVAAFASWDAFPFILNRERGGFFLNAGHEAVAESSSEVAPLNAISAHNSEGDRVTRDDRITFLSALDFVKRRQPKVLFLGLSGTDDAGHEKSYDRYLKSAAEADRMIAELWALLQSMPQYRDNTTLLVTTDHGRGASDKLWYNHGFFIGGSSQTWMALLGPSVKPLGEYRGNSQLYQKHISGTMGYLLGVKSWSGGMLPKSLFLPATPQASSEAIAGK